jgi:hypothetical protein
MYPDNRNKAASRNVFNNSSALTDANALQNAISSYTNMDFYDCASVESVLSNGGLFIVGIRIPNNLYQIGSDGIIPQPADGYSGNNHAMVILGITTKNIDGVSTKCWIVQNSWGDSWGDNGIGYLPYDWGCGVAPPTDSYNLERVTSWTCECYAVYDNSIPTTNPAAPTITHVKRVGKDMTISVLSPTGKFILLYTADPDVLSGIYEVAWYPVPSSGYINTSDVYLSTNYPLDKYYFIAVSVDDNNLLSAPSGVYQVDPTGMVVVRIGTAVKWAIPYIGDLASNSFKPCDAFVNSNGFKKTYI